MLKIGEFAGLTGLSVKALRHYDEMGVLTPAEVDERTGYRLYSEGQVRDGVVIRALRDAEVPLPEVSAALADGTAERELEKHQNRVLEQRELEDRAFADAHTVLGALRAPISITERDMPSQHYVAQVLTISTDDVGDDADDKVNEAFEALYLRLCESGYVPNGPFWMSLRPGEQDDVEVLGCWPTAVEVPTEVCGAESFSAALPDRTELVVTWQPGDDEDVPTGTVHPAVVGLFDAMDECGAELRDLEIRQTVSGQDAGDFAVELSVTVHPAVDLRDAIS